MSATLDAAAIRRLADMHAVYRLLDDAGTLLYVGMSGRTGRRFDDHAVKNWWPLVRTITLEWHDTKAQASLAERRAISTERPRYNKTGFQPPKKVPVIPQKLHLGEPDPAIGPRDLLADLGAVMENERIRLSELPVLLRRLAPGWEPYQKLTGVRLRAILKERGVRVVTKANVCRLDPADVRVLRKRVKSA